MRTFEILLVAACSWALLLSFRRPSAGVWSGVLGINFLALFLHGAVEGCRWQLALPYVLVPLLILHALAKASGRIPKVRTPKALNVAALALSLVFLGLAVVLACSLPVFKFPNPTGEYAVGIRYFHLVDEDRADPFLDKSTKKRELMVKVYYPAKPEPSKPFSRYFHASTTLTRAFAAFYQVPGFMFDHLSLVKTYAKDNLEPAVDQPSYPVVLFSHGAGTTMEVQTSQCQDLASHGYIVVGIDHPYVSAATAFPGRIVTAREATTSFDTPEPAEPITQIMAEDAAFVINKLSEINEGRVDPAFRGRLNLDALGIIGHSVGGAVAYNLAIHDSRIKAAVNLDGVVYVTPGTFREIAPFLMLAGDEHLLHAIANRQSLIEGQKMIGVPGSKEDHEARSHRARQCIVGLADVLKASGNLYTVEGSGHMKFTDIGLFIGVQWLRELMQIGGKTDPGRCLEITQALTAAFFDRHLKRQPADALTALPRKYPQLKKVKLN